MFYPGDIVMFDDLKIRKNNFFEKLFFKEKRHYVYSIDDKLIESELKNGDIYKVQSYYLGLLIFKKLNDNFNVYYTRSHSNFRLVQKK